MTSTRRSTEARASPPAADNPDVWWVHNDSGDTARFFAVSTSRRTLVATVDVDGATATTGRTSPSDRPSPIRRAPTVYLADIGDNGRQRPERQVYRVARTDRSDRRPTATSDATSPPTGSPSPTPTGPTTPRR